MENNLGNKAVMAENLKYYMAKKKISRQELADMIGVTYSAVRDYTKGKVYPRIDRIETMAYIFGCTKADLVEPRNTEPQNELRCYYKPEWKVLIDALEEATDDEVQKAADLLNALKLIRQQKTAD